MSKKAKITKKFKTINHRHIVSKEGEVTKYFLTTKKAKVTKKFKTINHRHIVSEGN